MKNIVKCLVYFLFYFLLQPIVQMGFMMVGVASGLRSETELIDFTMDNMLLMTIVSNFLAIGILVLFFKCRKKSVKEELYAFKISTKSYILPILTAFSYSMFWALVTYEVNFENAAQISNSVAYYSEKVPCLGGIMMAVALLIAAPMAEEVICRGIMVTRLERSFPSWVAVVISAVIFGLMHIMAGGVVLVAGAFLMGLIAGIIFVKTKSLYAAIVAHMFANLPDFVLMALPRLHTGLRWGIALGMLLIMVVCLFRLCKKSSRE